MTDGFTAVHVFILTAVTAHVASLPFFVWKGMFFSRTSGAGFLQILEFNSYVKHEIYISIQGLWFRKCKVLLQWLARPL